MDQAIILPGNIRITSRLVQAIRNGYSQISDVPNPICSITPVTLLDRKRKTGWGIVWFSKQNLPPETLFTIEGFELALSADVQAQLRGKTMDFLEGEVRLQ